MAVHLVTGASAGMGASCARALARRGDQVIAVARRADVLDELAAQQTGITPVVADVAVAADRAAIVEEASLLANGAPLASIIHGAATPVDMQPWTEIEADELTAHFHVHVSAAIALTGALHEAVGVERAIIFDSYSASTPRHGWSAYSVLKAGAQMAFRAAAQELDGVGVGRVYVGAVGTELVERVLSAPRTIKATDVFHELADAGRVSTPDEIAAQLLPILDLSPAQVGAEDTWHIGHPA